MLEANIFDQDKEDALALAEKRNALKVIEENRARKAEETQKRGARLTPTQWREIEFLWESGEVTLKDLSEKYGKRIDTFTSHFRKYKIKKGARIEELRKVAAEIQKEQARSDASIISQRIRDTKDQHYKMADGISRLVFNELLEVKKKGLKFREIQGDLKSLFLAMDTLKKCREERWAILGLDKDAIDEEALPELVMSTMTPEQAQELRKAQEEDEEEMGIDDDRLEMQEGNNNI